MCKLIFGAFFVALVAATAPAATDPIESTAMREIQERHVPGVVVVVVRDGHVDYSRGFGRASAERDTPVTPDMLFRVGSCTKMVTALTALSVAREHGIRLDAPIGKYVSGLAPMIGRTTLEQLLTHTSGLSDEIVATPIEEHGDESELLPEVRSWKDSLLFTQPGDIFSYSNLGFVLVGAFIEQVTGKRYADAVAERVLVPLGMTDATFRLPIAMTFPLAQGHIGRPGDPPAIVRPIRTDARHWPAGFLWASALDYARLITALMNHGMLEGRQVLPRSDVEAVTAPHVPMPEDDLAHYGYGLIIRDRDGVHSFGHSGRAEGYGAWITAVPDRNAAVILFQNRMDTSLSATRDAAVKLIAPALAEAPAQHENNATHDPIADFTGTYANGATRITVAGAGGSLTMTVPAYGGFPGRKGNLEPAEHDRFVYVWKSDQGNSGHTPTTFVRDAAGRVKYMAMSERAFRRIE